MKTILFFDDWAIQHSRGVVRRWFSAEPWPGHQPAGDPLLDGSFSGPTVERSPETGQWRLWSVGSTDRTKGDDGTGLYLYESPNGIDWRPCLQTPPADKRAVAGAEHLVFSGEHTGNGIPFLDQFEKDPARRYKIAYTDLSGNPVASEGTCKIAVLPDGVHWTIDRQAVWRDQHTDAGCSILYNPYTKKYQFTSRPILGDRRITLYETTDWKTFTDPQIIIKIEALNCIHSQYYSGMYSLKRAETEDGMHGMKAGIAYAEEFQRFFPWVCYTLPISDCDLKKSVQTGEESTARQSYMATLDMPLPRGYKPRDYKFNKDLYK